MTSGERMSLSAPGSPTTKNTAHPVVDPIHPSPCRTAASYSVLLMNSVSEEVSVRSMSAALSFL